MTTTTTTTTTTFTGICKETNFQGPRFLFSTVANLQLSEKKKERKKRKNKKCLWLGEGKGLGILGIGHSEFQKTLSFKTLQSAKHFFVSCMKIKKSFSLQKLKNHFHFKTFAPGLALRACLHGGGGPQVGEVTRLVWVNQ